MSSKGLKEIFGATPLAVGGENIVWVDPEDSDSVIKISHKTVEIHAAGVLQASGIVAVDVSRRQDEQKELKTVFGDHLVDSEFSLQDIVIDQQLASRLEKVLGRKSPIRETVNATVLLTKQKRIDLPKEGRVSFHLASLPLKDMSVEDLESFRDQFEFEGLDFETARQAFFEVYASDRDEEVVGLQRILKRLEEDEGFKAKLAGFVKKLVKYTNNTGSAIDIEGRNNVIFYPKDNKVDYVVLDPLMAEPKSFDRTLGDFREYLEVGQFDSNLQTNIDEVTIQSLNYLRTLNFFACVCGVNERVSLPASDLKTDVSKVVGYFIEKRRVN